MRRSLKAVIAAAASLAFFIAGLLLAWSARDYQISGQPMPNGKGGLMPFWDGYLIALVLLLFSLAWGIVAWRFCVPDEQC